MRSNLLLAAAVLGTTACAMGTATSTQTAPTFEAVVEQVLTPKCTFAQCHSNTTIAAGLDLTPDAACDTLVNKPSCLFPERLRVIPGNPDDSFFFHKVAGQGLNDIPTADCGFGSATRTNALMPFGASELDDDELQIVHGWISGGAVCESKTPNRAPAIASITATSTTPTSGETISFTVTLDRVAPAGGQTVALETNRSALAAPQKVVVPEGTMSVQFDAFAFRPTSRFKMVARAGDSSKEVLLRSTGIEIAEVLTNPVGMDDGLQWIKIRNRSAFPVDLNGYQLKAGETGYDVTTVQLTGTISAGGCVVIGGPVQSGANSEPNYSQVVNFEPDLPHSNSTAAGFALFDRNADSIGGVATPVDTMLVGGENKNKLLGPDAEIATPHCATPTAGMSALRTTSGNCVEAQMQPGNC